MKKTLKKWLESVKTELFNPSRSPEMKSLSVALGTFIAFSPFMGFHFIMAFTLVALYKPLDKILVVGFTMVNNWWTMVPIYAAGLWVGGLLTHTGGLSIEAIQWNMFTLKNFLNGQAFSYMGHTLKPMVLPFVVGNMVTAVLAAVISYYIVWIFLKKKGRRVKKYEEVLCASSGDN